MTDVTLTYNAGIGDCYGSSTVSVFNNSASTLWIGTDTDAVNENLRTWFPFAAIAMSKQTTLVSATLKVTASTTSGTNTVTCKIGCEAADNPANPTTFTDLLSRTLSTAFLNTSIGQYTNGVVYSYDITSAVQEILNRSGWAYGNTLAVIIDENDSTPHRRQVSSANSGANMAQLVLVARAYLPKAMFVG